MQKRLFLLAMALIILIPATGVFTGLGAMSKQEMRFLEGREMASLQKDFPKWFTDNLGLRHFFLNTYSTVLLYLFGQSSDEGHVQIGQNNFLFLGNNHFKTFSAHSGIFPPQDILRGLGDGFKNIVHLFQKNGTPVLIAIAPDKATIYGEYYPKWVKRVSRSFPRENFDNSALLKDHVLFIEDTLLEYKKYTDYLYWKNDTHWNELGAYLGYAAIMKKLEQTLGTNLERINIMGWKTGAPRKGDLARFNRVVKEVDTSFNLITSSTGKSVVEKIVLEGANIGSKFYTSEGLNALNIAIIHDSFYSVLPTPYRQTFRNIFEIHYDKLNPDILEFLLNEEPPLDLLIIFLVERTIPTRDARLKHLVAEVTRSRP